MILELIVAVAFGVGPPTVDITANVVLPMSDSLMYATGRTGIAWMPHVAFATPGTERHELDHLHQWGALGPGLPLAYGATLGRPFEDYLGDESMWEADDPMRCPLVRVRGESVAFLPCWTGG